MHRAGPSLTQLPSMTPASGMALARHPTAPRVSFLLIGAQKSASGWLSRALASHPEIGLPIGNTGKEVDFFNFSYHYGFGWYEQQFAPGRLNGDFSVLYLADGDAPQRAAGYDPGLKLLMILRDPVERALSHHRHEIAAGRVPRSAWRFDVAANANPTYFEHSRYGYHLARWLDWFPREQLHTICFRRIAIDPHAVINDTLGFLGLDATRIELPNERPNQPSFDRSPALGTALSWVRRQAKQRLSAERFDSLRNSSIARRVRRWNAQPVAEVLPPEALTVPAWFSEKLAEDQRYLRDQLGIVCPFPCCSES